MRQNRRKRPLFCFPRGFFFGKMWKIKIDQKRNIFHATFCLFWNFFDIKTTSSLPKREGEGGGMFGREIRENGWERVREEKQENLHFLALFHWDSECESTTYLYACLCVVCVREGVNAQHTNAFVYLFVAFFVVVVTSRLCSSFFRIQRSWSVRSA